ncbi:hypothetical protein G6F65_018645 [Rhizopus arrhizus]|nr:hypothetical protein G6F65_018645 [Rhizopus arrhizus]
MPVRAPAAARGVDFDDQACSQGRAVGKHPVQSGQEGGLRQRSQRHRNGQGAGVGEQPVQAQADGLNVALRRQAQPDGGRHEDRGRHGISARPVMQRQAGFVVQQRAGQSVQRLDRQGKAMLLQGSGQGIVPAVLADTGAVGGLAGRRDLIVVGAFGAHQGVVQAGQRIAHVVAGGESGHGQGPAAPAVLVHRDAQRTQLAADPFGQQAGVGRGGARHQQREVRTADASDLRRLPAEFCHQLTQTV